MVIPTKEEFTTFTNEFWEGKTKPICFSLGVQSKNGPRFYHKNDNGKSTGSLAVVLDCLGCEPKEGTFTFTEDQAQAMLEYFTPYMDEKIDDRNHENIYAIMQSIERLQDYPDEHGIVQIICE